MPKRKTKRINAHRDEQLASRVKNLRGKELTQEEFADALGVKQSAVSAWEQGWPLPSGENFVRLGNFAADAQRYEEAEWFWKHAGLKFQSMVQATIALLKDHDAPATVGRATRVPHNKLMSGDDKAHHISIQTDFLPDPLACSFVIIPDDSFRPLFNQRDVLVIDESETDLWNLVGDRVALYRETSWNSRLQKIREKLSDTEYHTLSREMGLHSERLGLHVGWLRVGEREGAKSLLLESPTPFGGMSHEVIAFEIPPMPRSSITRRIEVPAFTVIGRVVGWIDMRGKSLPGESSVKTNTPHKGKKGK